ncbi:recombinase family protein [Planctomicrobium sp. SH661]|uniref:recombinase family protein n=1 Tax=Planctomicrobium sp. SH661 TaxID=3448124 RepID=UPI003F5B3785
MNVLIWARVSSREQREGYSIDAQLRANRERAQKNGWTIVREFSVAESAKRGAERIAFNQMIDWVKANAKRENLRAILSHKLDRVCRNMRDAVRMQELEDKYGVSLAFVENQFGPGPAGALSFNVMAAVAQYYSDNLRTEVLKGIDERAKQGWQHSRAPFGYVNVKEDRDEPIQPHPVNSKAVMRLFELYSSGRHTFESVGQVLADEGFVFRPSAPKFHRTAVSYILNNRFYIGEIRRGSNHYLGRHQPLIDRAMFQVCQDLLSGKNRRATPQVNLPLSGGLFTCQYCGAFITGERIKRKLKGGGVRPHDYYRCANNYPDDDHPTVRWRGDDFEEAIIADLAKFKMPDDEVAEWFRTSLQTAFTDISDLQRNQWIAQTKRRSELIAMNDRLLNAFLTGAIDEATFNAKQAALRDELAVLEASLARVATAEPADVRAALAVFEFSQKIPEIWRGSKMLEKRRILETVSLNRRLGDVSLDLEKRKPFDELAKRLEIQLSRDDRI